MLHAVKWATFSNVASQVLVSAVTFILAALLNPAQFGTVAMAYLYITFLQQITGFGFNTALIQRAELKKSHSDSVFWLNIGSGVFFAVIAILLSGWWSRVNHMPNLQPMVIALSAIMPIEGFSVVQTALLQKRMEFKSLAIRTNLATFFGGITGVTMAFAGFGGWALVFQHIARELTSVITLWKISDWRPGFEFKWSSVKELSNYSGKTLLGRIGTFAQNSTDSLLIGVMLGPVALGLYRLANRLVEMNLMFLPRAIQIVSLPHFSKFQSDLPELNRNFLFASHLNSIVTFPSLAFLAGASSVILSAIGPQWSDATTVLRILSLIGISKTIILLIGPLLQAVSKAGTHSFNVWTLAASNGLAVLIAAFLFSHSTDDQQIAWVAVFRTVVFLGIFTPLLLWQAKRATQLSLIKLLRVIQPPIVIAIIIFSSQWSFAALGIWSHFSNRYVSLATSSMSTLVLWLICIRLLDKQAWNYILKGGAKLRNSCTFAFENHRGNSGMVKKSSIAASNLNE